MSIQSQLSIETNKADDFKPKNKPSHIVNWEAMKNLKLKKYLLLQVIRAINKSDRKYLSIEELCSIINRNTAVKSLNRTGIVKEQLQIYIENFIYLGFVDDSPSRGLVLNDKIYGELNDIDENIRESRRSRQ